MPNRELREAIRTSEKCADLTAEEFRLFVLLLTCADDFGLYHGNPRIVHSACFPFGGQDLKDTTRALAALEKRELIHTYVADEKKFVFIRQWKQRRRAIAPKYPIPSDLGLVPDFCPPDDGHPRPNNDIRITNNDHRITVKPEVVSSWWNGISSATGVPAIRDVTGSRKERFVTRAKDGMWEAREEIAREIQQSPFLQGRSGKSWRITFDWLLSNDRNWRKVVEGQYRDGNAKRESV